jgi:fumarylacetoacetate (FAA) hydrolase family protein
MATLPGMDLAQCLPDDVQNATLVGRAWVIGNPPGPSVVAIRGDGVFDLSARFATMSGLLDHADAAAQVRALPGRRIGSLDELLRNTARAQRDPGCAHLLAPCDLQVVKAAGVTFAASLIERVIEEQAGGDKARADAVRAEVQAVIGSRLAALRPGSEAARALKTMLQARGLWSQYLEVGIGPDAEVFTKAPVLAAVGTGVAIGIRADSAWNNPEPEVVLAVNSRGAVLGAALGNDVNLRDIEGRSALLLGKAKDNNASCAIGPFIRLFDGSFTLDELRRETLQLEVTGPDGYVLHGHSSMDQISRDPLELVRQTLSAHQYPDGFMLFLGTLFAPVEDRDEPGSGFTHKPGDVVSIRSPHLGVLINRVATCDQVPPWEFGLRALFENLAQRGLLRTGSA